MADTTFSDGTIVTTEWLNEVNHSVFSPIYVLLNGTPTEYTTLQAAVTGIGSTRCTVIVRSDITMTADATFPSTAILRPENGARITTTGYTLTAKVQCGPVQWASGTGTVTLLSGSDPVVPQWFGAVGDGTTDDSTAVATAVATGLSVDLLGKTYRIVTKITMSVANTVLKNGTLKFDGANTTRLMDITGNTITCENVIFDGNSKQPRSGLVYVDASVDRPRFIGCTFKDLLGTATGTTVLNQMYGLLINPYAVTNFEIRNCLFKNLRKYNDGTYATVTVGFGFVGGVGFLKEDLSDHSASQPTPSIGLITGCTFDTIQTILAGGLSANDVSQYDDGDAVRTYAGTVGVRLYVTISNCKFIGVSKRAVKLRASGGVFTDSEVYIGSNAYGMTTVVDVVHNCQARNIKIFTTSSLPMIKVATINMAADATNDLVLLDGIECNYATTGIEIIATTSAPLNDITIKGLRFPSCSGYGVVVTNNSNASTNRALVIDDVIITGSGNACQGLGLSLAADNKGSWKVTNCFVTNADVKIEGINNEVSDLTIKITSGTFAGSTSSRALIEFGSGKGLGGYNKINDLTIDANGISTSYTSASRPYLTYMSSDNLKVRSFTLITPESMSTTYPHFEGIGDDALIDGFEYFGVGFLRFGHLVASSRWSIRNAVRKGSGACSQSFWTLNSSAQYYEFRGITDFRPTTATTIVSATATNGIASDINTRSSNGTPAVSGVAKTADLNTF